MKKNIPASLWAPVAILTLALAAVAAFDGAAYTAVASLATLAVLTVAVRLAIHQRRRLAVLEQMVALLDAKLSNTARHRRR